MKNFFGIVTASFIFSSAAFALPGIQEGKYVGKGKMRTKAGMDSEYATVLIVEGNKLEASYDYGNGKVVTYNAEIRITKDFYFDVVSSDKVIGTGYLDRGMIHMDVKDKKAEETLVFKDKAVARIGSMAHGDDTLIYTEDLTLE